MPRSNEFPEKQKNLLFLRRNTSHWEWCSNMSYTSLPLQPCTGACQGQVAQLTPYFFASTNPDSHLSSLLECMRREIMFICYRGMNFIIKETLLKMKGSTIVVTVEITLKICSVWLWEVLHYSWTQWVYFLSKPQSDYTKPESANNLNTSFLTISGGKHTVSW